MKRFGGILSSVMTLLLVLAAVAGGAFFYLKTQFEGDGPLPRETAFVVAQGEGLADIAGNLEAQGIIRDYRLFVASAFLNDSRNKLKAGEYLLPANVSMEEVLETLVAGRSVQHKLTVPEGLTSEQVVQRVLAHPVLVGSVTEIPPEGSILPDTYVFLRGMTRQKLLDRMRSAQKKAVEDLWAKRAPGLPLKTAQDAVILASIVEKETGKTEERARVAAVFINRLKRKVRLQSDPTIIYGIVGGKGILERPITKTDIAEKTPYNTYQIDGLPPTPIANPGAAAIEAVLNPSSSNDFYFVADGTGGHAFAETLAEHRKNVTLWRQIEAERRRLQAAEEEAKLAAAEEAAPATATDQAEDRAPAALVEPVAPVAPAEAKLPPPPPPPPSAEPAGLRKQAAPAPLPKPKPKPKPKPTNAMETTGSVSVAAVEEAAPAEVKPKSPAVSAVGAATLTRSGDPVPKPRPKPDVEIAEDGRASQEPARAEEPSVTEVPAVVRRVAPAPAPRRSSTSREGFR